MVDYELPINPTCEPSPGIVKIIDDLSWVLPILAAILSIWGGVEALQKADRCAAYLGIAAGVLAAFGVLCTGWASRIRDGRLAEARSLGALGVSMAETAERIPPYE